jgi:hypothetical protein
MHRASRLVVFVALAGFAVTLSGCGSNNKGKIEGKWKANAVDLPGIPSKDKEGLSKFPPDAAYVMMEFTADGRMIGTMNLKQGESVNSQEVMSAKYSLGSGDWVNFTDMKPAQDGKTKSKDKIVINGDTMTIQTEKGEKINLTRMK